MKKILLSLVALVAATAMSAQGENLLTNGDFETWTDGQPTGWKSTTTASTATLSQSTDAHAGQYAVKIGGGTKNVRLAYKEITLKPGTYTYTIWLKAETADGATARIGYVPQKADGTLGGYSYSSNENGNNLPDTITNQWLKKTYVFTLAEKTKINLVVMNSKNYANKNVIADDASLTTEDGGIDDSGDDPTPQPGDGVITIKEAQAAAANTVCKVEGTVMALCKNGALLGDGTGYIYYFKSGLSGMAIGDKVRMEGAVSSYGGFNQYTNTATVTKLSTEDVTYPEPTVVTPDEWMAAPAIQYVKMTGILNISGNYYNLNVEGNETVGSIVAPLSSLTGENLTSGSTVSVYGFAIYSSGSNTKYVNIVATQIVIDNHVDIKDIRNTPETAYTVAQARQLITEGEGLDYKVYVKGTVKGQPTVDLGFGNATYWITDGTDTLEIYRGLYMKEEKFTNPEALKEGDEVIVYGQLTDFNGTYEMNQGNFLYSINGDPDKPQGEVVITFTDITIPEALAWAKENAGGVKYDNYKNLVMTNAEVIYAGGNNVFVRQDGKAVQFYNMGVNCQTGDRLNGTVRCSLESYYGVPEFITNDSTDVSTVQVTQTGSQPTPIEATVAQVADLTYLCDLVIVKGITITKEGDYYYMNDAQGNQAQFRTREPGIEPPANFEGRTYDVVGIAGYIHSNKGQIYALTITEDEGGGGNGIDGVTTDNGQQATVVFDLQGRRVVNPAKGIYIVNGKKVMK